MRTSGLLFTHYPDGSASLGFEDYGVEIFGGADYEVTYLLDSEIFILAKKYKKDRSLVATVFFWYFLSL